MTGIIKVKLKQKGLNAQTKTVEGILEFAQCVKELKENSKQGEFRKNAEEWWNIKSSSISEWIKISEDSRSAAKSGILPPSYKTINELTKLDDNLFNDAVKSGDINPSMTITDAKALRGIVPKVTNTGDKINRLIKQIDSNELIGREVLNHLLESPTIHHYPDDYKALIPTNYEDEPKLALALANTIQRYYHPDKGGDAKLSALANKAYSTLKGRINETIN